MNLGLRRLAILGGIALVAVCALLAISWLAADHERIDDSPSSGVDSLVISVEEDGFYRLSMDLMQEAGLRLDSLDQRSLRLSQGDRRIPLHFDGQALMFYGQAPGSRYALSRPYILQVGQEGAAMESVSRPPGAGPDVTSVPYQLLLEENNLYDGRPYDGLAADPAGRDPWFWQTIQVDGQVALEITLPESVTGPAQLELSLVGASQNPSVEDDHDLDLFLNGYELESIAWDGESAYTAQISITGGLLRPGANTLLLDNSGPGATPIDIMRLDRLRLTYQGTPVSNEDRFITAGVEGDVTIAGFEAPPLLFDISDPAAPILLNDSEYTDGLVRVGMTKNIHLFAVGPEGFRYPAEMTTRSAPQLLDSNRQADLIIIAPAELLPALAPLIEHRQSQGLTVAPISLEQIATEFADHESVPQAINAFVRQASEHWAEPRPAYLFLVGDASYDYRNYLGLEQDNLLPSPMVTVTYSGETISDSRLADVDGDLRPDLAVGRWPVSDPREVADLVERTLANEQATLSPRAIFAADGTESQFVALNEAVAAEAGLVIGQSLHLDGPTAQEIGEAWEEGAWLVTYAGHGSLDRWGKENVFSSEAVAGLGSEFAAPIVLQLTCLTGLFAHPTIKSLSEALLLDENGPISIVAATSLSLSSHQKPFGAAFVAALQNPEVERIGDAFQQAKLQLDIESEDAMREISDTFTLFGDPTVVIRRPVE